MSRGITEQDVWNAADALLVEGARPTIERVRQKIGRGSPNTVSPHLDAWFSRLGARIADPQAFRAPEPAAPEPVRALAEQLWQTAQALAHQAVEARALDAEARARAAEDARDAARSAQSLAEQRAQALAAELDALRLAHAAEHASLTERLLALQRHAEASAADLADARQRHATDLADAAQRVTHAERRAAADMDRERQARLHAEQLSRDARAEFDRTLADERARAQAQFLAQAQAASRLEARALALQERLDRMEAERLRVRIRERRGVTTPASSRARGSTR